MTDWDRCSEPSGRQLSSLQDDEGAPVPAEHGAWRPGTGAAVRTGAWEHDQRPHTGPDSSMQLAAQRRPSWMLGTVSRLSAPSTGARPAE